MALEPGSQTRALEQTGKSKKDAKMTPQTTNNREAPPMASGLRGRVLRTTPSVETKFDLQRPCLSGLGSIRDFLGFLGGHGVISRLRRENRAQEAV